MSSSETKPTVNDDGTSLITAKRYDEKLFPYDDVAYLYTCKNKKRRFKSYTIFISVVGAVGASWRCRHRHMCVREGDGRCGGKRVHARTSVVARAPPPGSLYSRKTPPSPTLPPAARRDDVTA